MTRINCIPPEALSDKHLGAEYRELPRVFALALDAWQRGEQPDDRRNPVAYTLGTGHVRFFYPRLGYLRDRFGLLVAECRNRGRAVNFDKVPAAFHQIPAAWKGGWAPTADDLRLNLSRIADRGGLRAGFTPKEIIDGHR